VQLLVLIEATGVLHLNWSTALTKAGYTVVVINPLIARRLFHRGNALRITRLIPLTLAGYVQSACSTAKNSWSSTALAFAPSNFVYKDFRPYAKRCAAA
jgi:hypothetical protein